MMHMFIFDMKYMAYTEGFCGFNYIHSETKRLFLTEKHLVQYQRLITVIFNRFSIKNNRLFLITVLITVIFN